FLFVSCDGSCYEVEQFCNGSSCFARFVRMKCLTNKHKISVSSNSGILTLFIETDGQGTVNMGHATFAPKYIRLTARKREWTYIIRTEEHTVFSGAVSMCNP
ncbi:diaminopimelate epimerase, partial [Pseudoalteromonas sp. S4389]